MIKEASQPPRRYGIGAFAFDAETLAPGLYIVATPIGNLGDVTLRALSTLAAADTVLCEDTRITARLFERFAIRTPLAPYHEHNAAKVRPGILAKLKEGQRIALVSDAGMPLVSDPGYRLVREAIAQGSAVTACPGPSAVLTGLALSGLPSDRFAFLGFVPQKSGERRKLLQEMAPLRATLIFFDSPHRICDTLADIVQILPGREVAVARELTKLYEEMLRGPAAEVAATLAGRPAIKGEITLLIGPAADQAAAISDAELAAEIAVVLTQLPASRAAVEIARRHGLSKKEVYDRILALKSANG